MKKVLVVESDQFIQDFTREVLEGFGCQVITVLNGEQVLAELKKNPDTRLVLLQIMLPKRSGWSVFIELRRTYPNLKVVFISAIEVSDERYLSLTTRDGLADYLVKPFTQERLLEIIRKILGKE